MLGRLAITLLVMSLALGACAAPGAGGPTAVPTSTAAPVATQQPAPTGAATAAAATHGPSPAGASPGAPVLHQAWATASLVDVTTGQPFRIAELVAEGKVVFVEPMAIWCTSCRRQQTDAVTALSRLDRSRVVWVGLGVDRSERAEDLAAYSRRHGFDFTYAVTPTEVAQALAADFGDLVLNPPATPIIVIGTDGTVTLTPFGHKSVDAILQLAAAHGA
jgi:thiol-disulfide isomerase/thioredoxin